MTQKKTYQAPAVRIYDICIEQPLLNNSINVMISNEETSTGPLTNKKDGFGGGLWSEMNEEEHTSGNGIWN